MTPNQKIALVTGANRGIGFEVSRQLAHKGIHVILTSRDPRKGEEALQKLRNEKLPHVSYHALDVTDSKSIDSCFEDVQKQFGRLDILVNNAGIFMDKRDNPTGDSTLFNLNLDTLKMTLETNTFGPIRMIQKFAPLMKKNHYGRIVNLSSGMGQLSEMNGGWAAYRISKTSLNAVTRISADELAREHILVNSVCPGWVKTDMGGPEADISVTEGADTIVWLATLPEDGPTGGFFRERTLIPW